MKRTSSADPTLNRAASPKRRFCDSIQGPPQLPDGTLLLNPVGEAAPPELNFDQVPPPAHRAPSTHSNSNDLFDLLLNDLCRQIVHQATSNTDPEGDQRQLWSTTQPYRRPNTRGHSRRCPEVKCEMPPLDLNFKLTDTPFPLRDVLLQHQKERPSNWPHGLAFLLEDKPFDELAMHCLEEKLQRPYYGNLLFDMAVELKYKSDETAGRKPPLLSSLYLHASWRVAYLRLFIRCTPTKEQGGVEALKRLLPPHSLPEFAELESLLLNSYNDSNLRDITVLVVERSETLRRQQPNLY